METARTAAPPGHEIHRASGLDCHFPRWSVWTSKLWRRLAAGLSASWIAGDYKGAYNRLAPELDPEGFRLFWAAEQQTGINIYRAFPIEDSLGYFESMSGYAMLEWLEAEAFGGYELETRLPVSRSSANSRSTRAVSNTKRIARPFTSRQSNQC